MATDIKCPSCGHQFPMEEAVSEQYKKDLREKMQVYVKQKEEEFSKKEKQWQDLSSKKDTEFAQRLQDEKQKLQQTLEVNLRKTISDDFENQLKMLEQVNKDNDEKLKLARQKELEFLQKEQELKNKEAELELSLQRRLTEERVQISEEIQKLEEQKTAVKETEYQMRLKELEKQLEDQKKLAEEMRRKAEQGSSQLQGEIQELALEEMLRNAFPFDMITEVGKGIRGADCVQLIRNSFGQECGKIIYESKRTNAFVGDWIEKLKADTRSLNGDIAVIVTKTMPKDMDCFGIKDGVWVCNFDDVRALAGVLREGVIRVYNVAKSNENKGDKMHMLYNYLTSNEFAEQWKAIREGFMSMKISIQKERDAMEKLWKAREKQLEKVLLNAAHIHGSVEGIAGQNTIDLSLEDSKDDPSLLENDNAS
jgi:hypothetical protein